MTDPSLPSRTSSPAAPQQPGAPPSSSAKGSLILALFKSLFNLVAVAAVVYVTYYVTMMFAQRSEPLPPLPENQKVLAKQAQELGAEGKKVLSSYGWVNPAAKSVRIPIERAMELIVVESAQPALPTGTGIAAPVAPTSPAPLSASTTSPKPPSVGATTSPPAPAAAVASTATPAPPPPPAGMPPTQIYRLVCITCHDKDGKGKVYGLAMPMIKMPDFTDPEWQASRADSELQHSILEGKESDLNGVKVPLMLPMKDKLALGHTDVKDMVAFVRSFKDGKRVVSLVPGADEAPMNSQAGAALAAAVPNLASAAQPVATPTVPPPAPAASLPSAPAPSARRSPAVAGMPTGAPLSAPAQSAHTPTSAIGVPPAIATTQPRQPSPAPSLASLPPALPVPSAPSAATTEKLRVAGGLFNTICIACHGPDGRGTLVRPAMPPIPDFSLRDWQTSRSNSQLTTSILEGKGTLMPPWNTKITADQARDLTLYVRNFGPPDLLLAQPEAAPAASTVEFDNKIRSLRQQFDELDKQLQALTLAPARP